METFKVKARLFTTALKSNLSQDNRHYTKNLRASVETFLQADQSWISNMETEAMEDVHAWGLSFVSLKKVVGMQLNDAVEISARLLSQTGRKFLLSWLP